MSIFFIGNSHPDELLNGVNQKKRAEGPFWQGAFFNITLLDAVLFQLLF